MPLRLLLQASGLPREASAPKGHFFRALLERAEALRGPNSEPQSPSGRDCRARHHTSIPRPRPLPRSRATLRSVRHFLHSSSSQLIHSLHSQAYTLEERVLPANRTAALKRAADVCLHPSKTEGFGSAA